MPARGRGRGRGRGVVIPRTMGTRQRAAPEANGEQVQENVIIQRPLPAQINDDIIEQPQQIENNTRNGRITVADLAKTVTVLQANSYICMNRVKQLETQMENSNVLAKGLDSKMDMLIQAMTGDTPEQPVCVQNAASVTRLRDTQPVPNDLQASINRSVNHGAHSAQRERLESLPPPGVLRREENLERLTDYWRERILDQSQIMVSHLTS